LLQALLQTQQLAHSLNKLLEYGHYKTSHYGLSTPGRKESKKPSALASKETMKNISKVKNRNFPLGTVYPRNKHHVIKCIKRKSSTHIASSERNKNSIKKNKHRKLAG